MPTPSHVSPAELGVAPPPEAQITLRPEFLRDHPDVHLSAMESGAPSVFAFSTDSEHNASLRSLIHAPDTVDVAQVLLLPQDATHANAKGIALLRDRVSGQLSIRGVESNRDGVLVPGTNDEISFLPGQSINIGRNGNRGTLDVNPADYIDNTFLFAGNLSQTVSRNHLTIKATENLDGFVVTSNGKYGTEILEINSVNAESGPDSYDVPEVPVPETVTPALANVKHPVSLSEARRAVAKTLGGDDVRDVSDDVDNMERDIPRYRALFAPPELEMSDESAPSFDYSILFNQPDEAVAAYGSEYAQRLEEYNAKQRELMRVDDSSLGDSRRAIIEAMASDAQIERIIEDYKEKNGMSGNHGVEALDRLIEHVRTDPNLRYDLGKYFMVKIEENWRIMPDRVAADVQKRPNHRGYKRFSYLSGREYAALLALSMIDGTFHNPAHDPVKRTNGRVELGQHRAAAELLLRGVPETF